jgi:hypothetical protein
VGAGRVLNSLGERRSRAVPAPLMRSLIRADGLVWAVGGKPRVVFDFTIKNGKIVGIDMIADPDHLGQLDVAFLDE